MLPLCFPHLAVSPGRLPHHSQVDPNEEDAAAALAVLSRAALGVETEEDEAPEAEERGGRKPRSGGRGPGRGRGRGRGKRPAAPVTVEESSEEEEESEGALVPSHGGAAGDDARKGKRPVFRVRSARGRFVPRGGPAGARRGQGDTGAWARRHVPLRPAAVPVSSYSDAHEIRVWPPQGHLPLRRRPPPAPRSSGSGPTPLRASACRLRCAARLSIRLGRPSAAARGSPLRRARRSR